MSKTPYFISIPKGRLILGRYRIECIFDFKVYILVGSIPELFHANIVQGSTHDIPFLDILSNPQADIQFPAKEELIDRSRNAPCPQGFLNATKPSRIVRIQLDGVSIPNIKPIADARRIRRLLEVVPFRLIAELEGFI